MGKKSKWYVVWQGHIPGVYDSWSECQEQVKGFSSPQYRSFASKSEALRAYEDGVEGYQRLHYPSPRDMSSTTRPILNALAVDAACSGNPGLLEYRGVMVDTYQEIFRVGPMPDGTNNIGEFLAIVHGLALIEKQQVAIPIYSDSVTAIAWVRNKRCKTLLKRTPGNDPLFSLVTRAEEWLKTHNYSTPIYKWDTQRWGEIPADFGRKK